MKRKFVKKPKNKYGLSDKLIMILLEAMDKGIYYRWFTEEGERKVNWCPASSIALDLEGKKIIMYWQCSDEVYEEFSFNKHKITWALTEEELLK